MKRLAAACLALSLLCPLLADAPAARAADRSLLFILDASGSMWGRVEGEPKIGVAKEVLSGLWPQLPADARVGLIAYGHRQKGDCQDIQTLVPLGGGRQAVAEAAAGLSPKGKTPLAAAVRQAVGQLRQVEHTAEVVLVSDGLESCGGDPCAAVREAKQAGVDFRLQVVGFGLGDADPEQLQCMAQAGDGVYYTASNAGELAASLEKAVRAEPLLALTVTANGEKQPARALVYRAGEGQEVDRATLGSGGGHYPNPHEFRLAPGAYDLKVEPENIAAPAQWRRGVEVRAEEPAEVAVDFSSGTLTVHVTANGDTEPARVYLYKAGTKDEVDRDTLGSGGGHYANPESFRLPPGSYDLKVRPEKIAAPAKWRKGLEVEAGQETETAVDFSSGTLTLHVTAGGETRPSRVYLYRAGTKDEVDRDTLGSGGGHYANPESFRLPPGSYDLKVRDKAKELPDAWAKGVKVRAGRETEVSVELAP
jgi:Ca-activated chloride channel family protein